MIFSMHNQNTQTTFIPQLKDIVGSRNVLTSPLATRPYRKGYRTGAGKVLAVVKPSSLHQLWKVAKTCVKADVIILMQAANTGLTGGSSPDINGYDRDIVLINAMAINHVHMMDRAEQVVCLPGASLHQLENILAPHGREPHSVIGSSCIGASVIGGICNSSGGALIKRGPAYTEYAVYGAVNEDGDLVLINNLGIDLGNTESEIFERLETGDFDKKAQQNDGLASDGDYQTFVREVHADTPARFNADPRRLKDASGCAGKVVVFAVRLDTFPKPPRTKLFYIGTNNPAHFTALRRHMLEYFESLPVSAEYIHREAFDIASKYGKDVFCAISMLGTDALPFFEKCKNRFDGVFAKIGLPHLSDVLLQGISYLLPNMLPTKMREYRGRFEHHLLLHIADDEWADDENAPMIDKTNAYLTEFSESKDADFFICSDEEAKKAFLHRFVVAAAPIRYANLYPKKVSDVLALDIALRRNDENWFEELPDEIAQSLVAKIYYGHFFCHVFHQDYLVKAGIDPEEVKEKMLQILDARGAEYPAEHNVGHMYKAKPALANFYKELDPCNVFNPGIGKTSKKKHWC